MRGVEALATSSLPDPLETGSGFVRLTGMTSYQIHLAICYAILIAPIALIVCSERADRARRKGR